MFATGPVPSPDCPAERPSVPAASCLWPSCCWARRVRTHPRACREAVAVRPREQPQAEVAQKSNSTAACWRLIYMSVHPLHLTTSHPIGSPTILTYITSQTHTQGKIPCPKMLQHRTCALSCNKFRSCSMSSCRITDMSLLQTARKSHFAHAMIAAAISALK